MTNFEKVKSYLTELEYEITSERTEDELVIINNEDKGIVSMILDCEDDILIIEQFIFDIPNPREDILIRLLQYNRELVHGSFVLDETASKVIFRDTLQLENLDLNELEASINALTLALAMNANELVEMSKAVMA